MATGFLTSNGTDLDDVFDPYVTGTSPATTGYQLSTGVDINTRYAPLSFGSAAAVTGYQLSNAADLNTLFAAKGTTVYWDGTLDPMPTFLNDSGSGAFNSLAEIIFNTNGTISQRTNYPFQEVILGDWDGVVANASNTEIRFVVTFGALTTNNATVFSPLTSVRAFSVESADGLVRATVTVELRQVGVPASVVSKSISVSARYL